MSRIIIGIHGLKNKPERRLLVKWWRKSICDGLTAIGRPHSMYRFDFAYWADLLHEKPMQSSITDPNDPQFLEEPYIPPAKLKPADNRAIRKLMLHLIETQMDKLFFNDDMTLNFSDITDMILRRFFQDLDIYFSKTCSDRDGQSRPARSVLREELAQVLWKHRRKRIMLVAHSMGTIIAYDTLKHTVPDVEIDTFVTMGSPLGLPIIIHHALLEDYPNLSQSGIKPRTPENVLHHWYNFSDLSDRVALNFDLADDYEPNSAGVQVVDYQVHNDYTINGQRNPHKIYGYLRTPEFSYAADEFLGNGITAWLGKAINRFKFDRLNRKSNLTLD